MTCVQIFWNILNRKKWFWDKFFFSFSFRRTEINLRLFTKNISLTPFPLHFLHLIIFLAFFYSCALSIFLFQWPSFDIHSVFLEMFVQKWVKTRLMNGELSFISPFSTTLHRRAHTPTERPVCRQRQIFCSTECIGIKGHAFSIRCIQFTELNRTHTECSWCRSNGSIYTHRAH